MPRTRDDRTAVGDARLRGARPGRGFWGLVGGFAWAGVFLLGTGIGFAQQSNTAQITNLLGRVELARPAPNWQPAKVDAWLQPGDEVRTLRASRADIVLHAARDLDKPRSLTLQEYSRIRIPDVDGPVDLWSGLVHFFSRTSAQTWSWATETVFGSVKGTDFAVLVRPDGTLLVRVDQGEVELTERARPERVLHLRDRQAAEYDAATGGLREVRFLDQRIQGMGQNFVYYPGLLDLADLNLAPPAPTPLGRSIDAYARGDLPRAVSEYAEAEPVLPAEHVYHAFLLLAAGLADQALAELDALPSGRDFEAFRIAARRLTDALAGEVSHRPDEPRLATEWLAESYYQVSRVGQRDQPEPWEVSVYGGLREPLSRALEAAKRATPPGSSFGYGWVRRAELEFSHGRFEAAEEALKQAGDAASHHAQAVALRGFLAWARQEESAAREAFRQARLLDARLGNAWLGSGLEAFHQEDLFALAGEGRFLDFWRTRTDAAGLSLLELAVAAEPRRSVLRSYLGKAYYESVGFGGPAAFLKSNAVEQLRFAARLDPQDPTPHLYSALMNRQENRVNDAVRDLEASQARNDGRSPFRSRLLLDEDRAVRAANLAGIYDDAGLQERGIREGALALDADYANGSAHLFLAQAYNALRDPTLSNLRYESTVVSEYLLANLLAPPGAAPLSPLVSQQEYTRLLERDRLGLATTTEFRSDGDGGVAASQFGWVDRSAYALEGTYRMRTGPAPNTDLDQQSLSLQFKQGIGLRTDVYLQVIRDEVQAGDVQPRYDPATSSLTRRIHEVQEPNAFVGVQHEWSPGHRSLVLLSSLSDRYTLTDSNATVESLLANERGVVTNTLSRACADRGFGPCDVFDLAYQSDFQVFGLEIQQVFARAPFTLIAGGRFQAGDWEATDRTRYDGHFRASVLFEQADGSRSEDGDLRRAGFYGYGSWNLSPQVTAVAGVAWDWIRYPTGLNTVPVAPGEGEDSQVSPKLGLVWEPHPRVTLRAAYSESLGGLLQEQSVRLEPTQVAGVNQAYRSLAPEAVVGSVPAARMRVFGTGLDTRLPGGWYAGIALDGFWSEGEQRQGVFAGVADNDLLPAQVPREVRFREVAASAYLHKLVGRDWAFGLRYRLSDADVETRLPAVSTTAWRSAETSDRALLQQVGAFASFQHPSGVFARFDARWFGQDNRQAPPEMGDDRFWQLDAVTGYRFARRRAEISVGLLNLTGQDYRLHPLNGYPDLPRDRAAFVRFRINL